MPNKRWKMTSLLSLVFLVPTFRAQWFWIILIHYIWRFISCFTSIWSCRHLFSPEAKSCLVLRSLAWKMLHIIYFDHKVNPCNGCTLRQVPLHMIPNFLTLTPGGHDSSYECDRHCWCRCDDNKYCLITSYIDWFSSPDFVSQFFFSVDFWHCR